MALEGYHINTRTKILQTPTMDGNPNSVITIDETTERNSAAFKDTFQPTCTCENIYIYVCKLKEDLFVRLGFVITCIWLTNQANTKQTIFVRLKATA